MIVNNSFQEGDCVKIEMLEDNALKISGEQPKGNGEVTKIERF